MSSLLANKSESTTALGNSEKRELVNQGFRRQLEEYIAKLQLFGCMNQRFAIPRFEVRLSKNCYLKYSSENNLAVFFLSPEFSQSISSVRSRMMLDLFVELLALLYYGNGNTANRVFIRSILNKEI